MNISILSMHKVDNFGSLLQAYALKKMLGCDNNCVRFIDIQINEEDYALTQKTTVISYEAEREGKAKNNKLLNKLSKFDRFFVVRMILKLKNKLQIAKFEKFRRLSLGIKGDDNSKHYELCVIGSDEVFNCTSGVNTNFTSQLFGNVQQADNVITYAASCGAIGYEHITQSRADIIRRAFKNISAFSVRDKNTESFVKELSDKDVHIHLDPVLVGDFEEEIKQVELPPKLPQKYCIVYSYYNRIHKKEEIEAIKNFCKEKGLEIVAIGAPQKWIKKYIVMDPFQVLAAFQNAEFVITDTFHGTIFASKYNGRFATIVRESNRNKLTDLIYRIGVQDHMVSDISELDIAWKAQDSKQKVNNICKIERDRTLKYLENAINRSVIKILNNKGVY